MMLKWSNLKKIVRKSQGSISKINCFVGQKSIVHHYIQNVKDGNQIRVYTIKQRKINLF